METMHGIYTNMNARPFGSVYQNHTNATLQRGIQINGFLGHARIQKFPSRGRGGGSRQLFSVISVFHRGPCGPPSRSNWTRVNVPDFLRKPIATYDFPG